MNVQASIESKLMAGLAPRHLEVVNESHMHGVPPGSQSHFKVVIVADAFEGKRLVGRHRSVNALLADELEGPVHALSMETLTAEEWTERGGKTMQTPDCLGGGKAER